MRQETRASVLKMIQANNSKLRNASGYSLGAFENRALAFDQSPTHPGSGAITAFAGVKLVARASGLFVVSLSASAAAAAAADVVTWTVTAYNDTVVGTPMTLPAAAALVAGSGGVYTDNAGTGVAPTAGDTATAIAASAKTIGTAAVGDQYQFSGILCTAPAGVITPVAKGANFYVTLSITDSVAFRALTNVALSMFELP
ncbi:MAG: hypothetical protein ACYDEA_01155 [Candidatus Dormibacteria bacterium]